MSVSIALVISIRRVAQRLALLARQQRDQLVEVLLDVVRRAPEDLAALADTRALTTREARRAAARTAASTSASVPAGTSANTLTRPPD